MKSPRFLLAAIISILSVQGKSQISFTLNSTTCVGYTAVLKANTGTLTATSYSWSASPQGPLIMFPGASLTSIYFPGAGIHTVALTVTTSSGTYYADNFIIVNPSPSVSISPASPTICPGQSTTLFAFGAQYYNWSPAGSLSSFSGASVIASPSVSTNYTIFGSNSICSNSATVDVTVNSIPNLTISTSAIAVCAGTGATLTASGALTYTWNPTGYTTNTIVVGPGIYQVTGSNGPCADSLSINIGVANCTDLENFDGRDAFYIYPNPFTDNLFIKTESAGTAEIEITDIFGKLVFAEEFDLTANGVKQLGLHKLPPGFYFVKISSGDGKYRTLKAIRE